MQVGGGVQFLQAKGEERVRERERRRRGESSEANREIRSQLCKNVCVCVNGGNKGKGKYSKRTVVWVPRSLVVKNQCAVQNNTAMRSSSVKRNGKRNQV